MQTFSTVGAWRRIECTSDLSSVNTNVHTGMTWSKCAQHTIKARHPNMALENYTSLNCILYWILRSELQLTCYPWAITVNALFRV